MLLKLSLNNANNIKMMFLKHVLTGLKLMMLAKTNLIICLKIVK